MKSVIIILALFFFSGVALSQTIDLAKKTDDACLELITDADRLFIEGQYEICIELLEGVLTTCDLSRNEKMHSMELLAKSYVEAGLPEKAEITINVMLANFPHYELKEQDNPELFNLLIKKYRIHPKFSLGIRNTADWVSYKTTKVYTVHDEIDYSVSYNQNIEGIFEGFGLMYYGWAEYEFFSDISLNGELIFKWTKFVRELTRPSVFELQFSESDSYIEIPIYLKKYFHIDKNTLPYIAAGIGWLYLTKADANATIIYTDDGTSESTGNISMLGLRNRNTFEWIAGAGVGYKHKNLRLFLDARYYCGINSFTNPEKGLSDNVLVNDFYYIDNNVKLNQFEIGASISYTLINSVKRVRH